MNILHIKLYVMTDIKECTEEILFHNIKKNGKLFRIPSSYQRRHLLVCTVASIYLLGARQLRATSQPCQLEQWNHTQLQEHYFSFVFSKGENISNKMGWSFTKPKKNQHQGISLNGKRLNKTIPQYMS